MKENQSYDVIVIGAGFGGPVAAKLCADAGLKTLLVERAKRPGEKVISGLTIPFYGFLFGPDFILKGNPPIERPADGIINYIITDIDKEEIEIDDTLKIPKPFSPIISFGYNAYCQPFCEWETNHAIESGVIFKPSTTVVDLIKEDGYITGILTDEDQKCYSKIVIDAEGSQGLIAVKAGIREKYPPEAIALADTYDYEMPKRLIDEIFGFSVRFCWGFDEQKIAPPLGYGNGLMVWPYRGSLHFIQDQCLKLNGMKVPDFKKAFKTYHQNITQKLPWWREEVTPNSKLRAKVWQCFEIFVGINKKLRKMPNYGNGILLIGDAAGLESTELCDGVPSAWFSAEIAAKVAIDAIKRNDVSADFLRTYNEKIKKHPIIQWSISGSNRFILRYAQKNHDMKLLKEIIHDGWGLGQLNNFTAPFLKIFLEYFRRDRKIINEWILMFFRYFQNWLYNSYGESEERIIKLQKKYKLRTSKMYLLFFNLIFRFIGPLLETLLSLLKRLTPLSIDKLNALIKKILPKIEPTYLFLLKILEPFGNVLSKKLIEFTLKTNPSYFKS
ncbi:MAG: NAD(P)/FAD-dependent oxidoreductase [Promethearchaeota archaeon]|nr:MAG: NAD(P)/FAD-dependent oxidoreductase [Candidatus Lokiarchaeota archaeon]